MAKTDLMAGIGVSGLKKQGGIVYEEYLPELRGDKWYKVIRQMQDDPIVSAILYAIEMLTRKVEWNVRPADESPAAEDAAVFVESCLDDMSNGWGETVAEILTMLPYGWCWMEQVYKLRNGDNADPSRNSKHNDGKIGWRKWAIRGQDTLDHWVFDEDGGIQAMVQTDPDSYQTVPPIPIDKSLLFRTTTRKNNPEGRSVLRGAYRSWYFKRHMENIEGIGIERDLAGLPVAYVPPNIMAETASVAEKAVFNAIKNIVTSIKRDEMEGVVFPMARDDSGNMLYELTLLSSGGSRQFDTDKTIQRYSQQIAMSVLADFIMVGHGATGSYALMGGKVDLFVLSLRAYLDSIASVINSHALPRLFRLNGMSMDLLPTIEPSDIERVDLVELGDYITKLAGAGFPLFPNSELEHHLLQAAGLPVAEDMAHE